MAAEVGKVKEKESITFTFIAATGANIGYDTDKPARFDFDPECQDSMHA